ncbi:MAG: RagB/SusD family nutrient uptake outer membrane protein [Prevotellaceae bacterium]|nr:RagB/SusD family nutrient uptake outer membrane protein [Candidatus Minthosoma caballi]
MKLHKIILPLVALAATFTSCDNYIDITPKGALTIDSAYTYLELVANPMRCYYPSSFAYLSDDLWAKESKIIGNESVSHDAINFTFNEAADRTLVADNNLYENMYSDILRCNLIISNIDAAPGTDEVRKLAKAEARCIRAFNHFLAVNTYAKAYDPATAATDGGVCVMDHYTLEDSPRKSTVAQTYDFIIRELEECVPELQKEPLNIYHPNLAFGWALLSKVYLFHRDWAKAEEAANNSLAINKKLADYNLIEANGGVARYREFADANNPEVLSYMWMGSGWTNEAATYYAYGIISPELISLFEPNDLRYSLFFRQSGTTITNYYDEGSGAAIWTPANTTARFTHMTVGMRTAEVYLILAEACARQSKLPDAIKNINIVRACRLKGNYELPQPSSQHDMMELIITERRKELLFGFHRFFDLKRFNLEPEYAKTITRKFPVVTKTVEQKTYTLQPNSPLYIIPFPRTATDKNSNLTQNF